MLSYRKAEVIYDFTFRFCEKCLKRRGDRTIDQMVQAARSGKKNIAEASKASVTSSETEPKLTNVARASLEELLPDCEDFPRADPRPPRIPKKLSFTVYTRPRPIRSAFVLDTSVYDDGAWISDALVDGIVHTAMTTWGGRQNPIVLLDPASDLSAELWNELEIADPDRIQALSPLNDAWVNRFHLRFYPWKIATQDMRAEEPRGESLDAQWIWPSIELPGVATPPTPENLSALGNTKLLMIEFGSECPLPLRRFFHRNFGTYYQWSDGRTPAARRLGWLENLLPKIEISAVRIDDISSACDALSLFAGSYLPPQPRSPLSFISPLQLSSVELGVELPSGPYTHSYTVFIGDSPRDYVAMWNDLRVCGCTQAPHKHSLWIPKLIADAPEFQIAVQSLLYHYSGKHSSGSRSINITSETLPAEDLIPICERLNSGRHRLNASVVDSETRRSRLQIRDDHYSHFPRQSLNNSNAERLRMPEPIENFVLSGSELLNSEGQWAVDVQIESGVGTKFDSPQWWCFPRESGSRLAATIFRTPSRVNRWHLFSVEVERQSKWFARREKPELHIALPDEDRLVGDLLINRGWMFDHDDVRKSLPETSAIIRGMQISDKGKNLRGLIQAFGDFWTVEKLVERRFWREALATLAGHDATRSKALSERIKNVVRKTMATQGTESEQTADRIVSRLMPHVQGALDDKPMSFAELKSLLDKVTAGAAPQQEVQRSSGRTVVRRQGVSPVSEDELKEGLDLLLAKNILRAGVMVHCRHCGLRSWLHVDEVRQFNECSGCGNARPLAIDSEWHYRLNSLVKRCVSVRIFAVLQALAALSHSSHASFFYYPSFELFTTAGDNPWHEIDIACICNGRLILGEVKDGSLKEKDLDRFAEAVEALKPDVAALFIPQHRFDQRTQQLFCQFQARIFASKISAELHQLPSY